MKKCCVKQRAWGENLGETEEEVMCSSLRRLARGEEVVALELGKGQACESA